MTYNPLQWPSALSDEDRAVLEEVVIQAVEKEGCCPWFFNRLLDVQYPLDLA